MKKLCTICLILLLSAMSLHAIVASAPSFRHYTTSDGLPSNCIRAIVQDSCGFVWFATDGGLVRFDGRQFKVFLPTEAVESSVSDNYVTAMAITDNSLWIATDNGLLCYDPEYERLSEPELRYADEKAPKISGNIFSLTSDRRGNIWVGMSSTGIYRVSPDMVVEHFSVPAVSNSISNIYVDCQDEVWALGAFVTDGLFLFDAETHRFRKVPIIIDGKGVDLRSSAMVEDRMGRVWIGEWNGGLICYDPVTGKARKVPTVGQDDTTFHIHSMTLSPDNLIMMGVDRGLAVYDPESGRLNLYERDELRTSSLSGPFVYPIMTDSEGGVWIGTFYAGVNYRAPNIKHFESARHSRFVNSVSGNIISSFCEDKAGNIYIGSDDGGLCCFDPSTGIYRHIPLGTGSGRVNVHSLCMDGDDLWIGTYAGGVRVYDTVNDRLKRDFSASGSKKGDVTSSYAIFRDRQANMWVATMDAVMMYDRDKDCFEEVRNIGALVSDIAQDESGNLWFSTQGKGLFKYQPRHRVWKNYRRSDNPGSLLNNHVAGVDIDADGNLWVATGTGICRYRPDTDDFEALDLGVGKMSVFLMKADGRDLWIGTASGLLRYRPGEGTTTFTSVDGLVDDQFTLNAVHMASDGMLYVGTVGGYSRFCPASIGTNGVVPALQFTGLDIGGHAVEVGDSRLPRSLNSIDVLNLAPDDYAFSISFAAMSFANPGRNSYMYKLDGFDKEWIEAGNENKATYTNLPPGDYTMLVKASNNDGIWNTAGISLPIHISPPWYATWFMKLLYILAIAGVVTMVTLVVMRRNNRKHRAEIDKVNAAKEMEVYEAKVNFFTTIAHEIRTPVSLIIGPLENIMQSDITFSPQEHDDIDIIYRNSQRLLFLVNQLLDFKKVEKLALDARFSSHDIPSLLNAVAMRFQPSLKHRGARLVVDMPESGFSADVDAEALTKLVSNLLNNARKFTRDKVSVACFENRDEDSFTIKVGDNGVGISEDDIKRIFKPFVQVADSSAEGGTGLGLSIVMRVVKAHGGTINVDSIPGEGSVFTVVLPLRQEKTAGETAVADNIEESAASENALTRHDGVEDSVVDKPIMLVVDDNPDLLRFMSNNFSDAYNVVTVGSGEDALERISCQAVDIIVSDWMMPGMSGIELCAKVRADMSTSHIPFVLLTAKTDNYSKIEGLNCGADAYVEKPFSVSYLKARLRNLGEMRHLLRRKFSSTPLEPIETLAPTPLDSDFLRQLTAVIEENFSNQELSVDFIARTLGVSRSGLYSKIKTLANITPNELIQITRLKKAAQLLTENKYRVSEICYMVGFNSPSYFAKCFQKQFGMKPGEFTPQSRD